MKTMWLTIQLKSDTVFGRGDGVAGLVNAEVQHDDYGLPYLSGKTLKGLLTATCGEIISALQQSNCASGWDEAAQRLFGGPGSRADDIANLHIGDAQLPSDLRQAVASSVMQKDLAREDVLNTLTSLRRQTAMNAETGAPQRESLRTIRVILRETVFMARLTFLLDPLPGDLPLLAACVRGLRRVGTNRNRGLGRVVLTLYDAEPVSDTKPITDVYFEQWQEEIAV